MSWGWPSNFPLFHGYILWELLGLLLVFYWGIRTTYSGWHLLTVGLLFASLWGYNVLVHPGIWHTPTYIRAVEAVICIGLAGGYLLQLLQERKEYFPHKTFPFWVSFGMLLFFTGNLILYSFAGWIQQTSRATFTYLWGLHAVLSNLMYVFYTLGLVWANKNHS
ncbi:MAG: hypothetical protein AAFQ98_22690 [Bacteroidota bacterium]